MKNTKTLFGVLTGATTSVIIYEYLRKKNVPVANEEKEKTPLSSGPEIVSFSYFIFI